MNGMSGTRWSEGGERKSRSGQAENPPQSLINLGHDLRGQFAANGHETGLIIDWTGLQAVGHGLLGQSVLFRGFDDHVGDDAPYFSVKAVIEVT